MIRGHAIEWTDEDIEELSKISDRDVEAARDWSEMNSRTRLLFAQPDEDDDADFTAAQ